MKQSADAKPRKSPEPCHLQGVTGCNDFVRSHGPRTAGQNVGRSPRCVNGSVKKQGN